MLRTLLVVLSVAAGGCGRIGFDVVEVEDPGAIEITSPPFSTSSAEFVDVPDGTLLVPPSAGSKWLLLVSASLSSTVFNAQAPHARYLVDGIERGIGGTESFDAGHAGPWQHFYVFDGGDAETAVVFQLRDEMGGTTTIEDLRAVAVRLPPAAEPLYASADAPMPVATLTFATVASFDLEPASPGEYLVLMLANSTDMPGGGNVYMQWLDTAGQPWTPQLTSSRGAWQSHLWIRRTTLAGPSTIAFQGRTTMMGQAQYARVLALRTDAFAGQIGFAQDMATQTTTASTVIEKNQLSRDVEPALVLGTTRLDDDCSNAQFAARGIHYTVAGMEQTTHHRTGHCGYTTTYGIVDLVDEAPVSVSVGFSSGNGQIVQYVESTLVIIGLTGFGGG